jgi:hypothetical protein
MLSLVFEKRNVPELVIVSLTAVYVGLCSLLNGSSMVPVLISQTAAAAVSISVNLAVCAK